jgi:CMP-N,N'-diacetyllegionaminic acid synthase
MLEKHRIVALIPLRGGSKSIKNKNLRFLGGKPLMAHSIEVALQVPEIDRIIVSTDSLAIAEVGKNFGAEIYMRPEELATDTALVIDVIRDLRETLNQQGEEASIMVLLEATSPLRSVSLVRKCLQRLVCDNYDSIATFQESDINPHRTWKIDENSIKPFISGAIPWLPRQQLPDTYQLNGAVYAFFLNKLMDNVNSLLFGRMAAEIMNDKTIDIDNEEDLIIAEALFESRMFANH